MPTRQTLNIILLPALLLLPASAPLADDAVPPAATTPAVTETTTAPPAAEPAPAPAMTSAAQVPPPAAADDAEATVADLNHQIRERFANRNWRLGTLGGFAGSFGLQRRFWARSGLSVSFYGAQGHPFGAGGYDMGGLAFGWWREHTNRLFPVVWGWGLSAGPLVSSYSVPVSDREEDGIAAALGGAGAVSLYAIVPVFSLLFDAAPHGLIPYLTLEWSAYAGRVGAYRVTWTKDFNGDGVNEYVEGDRFRDPGGRTRRTVADVSGHIGLVWIW